MTREEAHRILSNGLVNAPSEHEWVIAFRMAIKAIKQESVLDKIRAEIQEELKQNNHSFYRAALEDVLKIIDKYRAESEDENDER